MDTIISALLVADNSEQTVAHSSLNMCSESDSDDALLDFHEKIVEFSTLCVSRTRSIRNTKVAVSRLPNELLLAIFRILSAAGPLSAWLWVTYVCRHWRNLALSDPILWTEIDFEYPEPLIELLLLRSRNMPLSLSCENNYVIDNPVAVAMLKRNAEVRHISIKYTCAVDLLRVFAPMLSNLNGLVLNHPYTTRSNLPLDSDRPPNLRSLIATRCTWRLVVPFLRSLQTLELRMLSRLPNIATLLDALEACPALEVFTLRNCLPSPLRDKDYDTYRAVALSKLKRLRVIESSQAELGFLCSRLSLPADTNVYLEVECSPVEALPLRKKAAPIPHIFLKDQSLWPMLVDAKRLAFGFHKDYIMLYLSRNADSHTFPFLMASLDITKDLPPTAAFLPEVLDVWLISMASPGVRSIDIHGVPEETFPRQKVPEAYRGAMERFRADLWQRVFSSFPNLASLRVHCVQDVTALANALWITPGDVTVPVPELKELSLRCRLDVLVRSALLRALLYRNTRGARLDTLRLVPPRGKKGLTLPDGFVEDIRKVVDKLFLESGRPGEEGYKKDSDVKGVSVDTDKPTTAVADAYEVEYEAD